MNTGNALAILIGIAAMGAVVWQARIDWKTRFIWDDGKDAYLTSSQFGDGAPGKYDIAEQASLSAKALSASPILARQIRTLAIDHQDQGDIGEASALMSEGAALGWRDVPTQLWLAQAYLNGADYHNASLRLDAALRVEPQASFLFDVLDQGISIRGLNKEVIARLTLKPDWRSSYFAHSEPYGALQPKADLIKGLVDTASPPSRDETRPILNQLFSAHLVKDAFDLWQRTRNDSDGSKNGLLFTFENVQGGAPFDWSRTDGPGINSIVSGDQPSGDTHLHVEVDGTGAGVIARRILVLKAGKHSLSTKYLVPHGPISAFSWSMRCSDEAYERITWPIAKDIVAFEVPSERCPYQEIDLRAKRDEVRPRQEIDILALSID